MKKLLLVLAVLAAAALRAVEDDIEYDPWIRRGDTVVLIGDSITEQGFRNAWGYYHVLTNAVRGVTFIPLGYSGYQVKDWRDLERKSVKEDVWTWYREPAGWNLKAVFDGKVDVLVIFLGMNDLLQPSIHDDEADITRWLSDYAQLVLNLKNRCHPRKIVLASITPLTADAISPKNQMRLKLNNRLASVARILDAEIVDFGGTIERLQGSLALSREGYRLVPDFVHPNALGHTCLALSLCENAGLQDETMRLQDEIEEEVMNLTEFDKLRLIVRPIGLTRPTDDEYLYLLSYSCSCDGVLLAELKLHLPKGWTADVPRMTGNAGNILLRGKATQLKTNITVEAWLPGNDSTVLYTVDIPAPWRVREDGGPWTFYSATSEYTGGDAPGSIDPYQVSFGWKTNTFTAARRVWSEKAREVKAVLSHQGFSQTLDLTVMVNGAEVWKDNLDRNGRNRREKVIRLKEGWNALEIVCTHHDWQRQFSFDLEPVAGDDLSKLQYDLK